MKLFLSTVGLSCLLMAGVASADGNIFCNHKPTAHPECQKAMEEMYKGMSEGYTKASQEHQEGKTEKASKEEFENILSYKRFQLIFKICGEKAKVEKDAGPCLVEELEKVAKEEIKKKMGTVPTK